MLKKNKKFQLTKSLFFGMIWLVIGFWFWYAMAGNPFDEYALIRSGIIANGHIVNVEEYEDAVEEAGRESVVPKYSFEYNFVTVDGRVIKDYSADNGGHIPDSLEDVNETPHPIQVEYLSRHPNVNRVIGMHTGCTSIGEWIFRKITVGGLVLLGCLSLGILSIKQAVKTYKVG
jgi:hypothetical protein